MALPPAFAAGLPPSMPAGSHEMRDYYSNQDPPRLSPHTAPSVTPYLGLRARLSQIWLNRWTILLLLVLARTLLAISGINDDLGSARREALSACSSVESMGSAMASMPHYMSQGVNELTAQGVEKSVNGLMQMTVMSVTGVEEIVLFVINMLTSTYLCLITLAVSGSLHAVIGAVDAAQNELHSATSTIGDGLSSTVSTFEDAYNAFVKSINVVSGLLDAPNPAPTLNLSSQIDDLKNLQLPAGLDADLQKLNKSIPTFAQVKNFTDNIIRLPFEEVKGLISDSLGNYTFNRSTFPVPGKQQLSFCSANDGINEFFDNLVELAKNARKIFLAVLLLCAILVCIPMAWREIRRFRKMQASSQLVGSNSHDPMDVVYIVSRPYTSSAGIKFSKGVNSTRRQALVRWVIAYATSDAALFVLAIAIAGLFSCLCQIILLKSLEKEVPALSNQVGAFADKVILQLNNASAQWAIGANDAIAATNREINDNMFGWVNTTTKALNDTLNAFVDETTDVLNTTFGGTILYDPILEVLNCLVLLKVAGIQNAITWVSENAQVNFPGMPNDTFSLGAAASISSESTNPSDSFLSSPGDQASDKITEAVARFVDAFREGIKTEVIISTMVLLVWIAVVLIGVLRALTLWFGHDRVRGDGGAAPDAFSTAAPSMRTSDFRSDDQDRFQDLRSENQERFVNVPLTANNTAYGASFKSYTPAPEYTESKNPFGRPSDDEGRYEDQKLGMGISAPRDLNGSTGRKRAASNNRISIWDSKDI